MGEQHQIERNIVPISAGENHQLINRRYHPRGFDREIVFRQQLVEIPTDEVFGIPHPIIPERKRTDDQRRLAARNRNLYGNRCGQETYAQRFFTEIRTLQDTLQLVERNALRPSVFGQNFFVAVLPDAESVFVVVQIGRQRFFEHRRIVCRFGRSHRKNPVFLIQRRRFQLRSHLCEPYAIKAGSLDSFDHIRFPSGEPGPLGLLAGEPLRHVRIGQCQRHRRHGHVDRHRLSGPGILHGKGGTPRGKSPD